MEPVGILVIMLCLLLFFVIKLSFIGMAILIQHARPDFIKRAHEQYTKTKKGTRLLIIVLGLLNGVAIPFIALLLISTEVLALPGLLVLLVYLWMALLSYTVIYRSIGLKVLEDTDSNSEFRITLIGGLIAEAAFFTPVLGQLYSIALFIRSLGAIVLTVMKRR